MLDNSVSKAHLKSYYKSNHKVHFKKRFKKAFEKDWKARLIYARFPQPSGRCWDVRPAPNPVGVQFIFRSKQFFSNPFQIAFYGLCNSFVFPLDPLNISFGFPLYFLWIALAFPWCFLSISLAVPLYFRCISFIIPLGFLCIALGFPLDFLCIFFVRPLYVLWCPFPKQNNPRIPPRDIIFVIPNSAVPGFSPET